MARTWREVRRCHTHDEAARLKAMLDAAGIETVIPDQRVLGRQAVCRTDTPGVRLLVAEDQFERAIDILRPTVRPRP